MECIASLSEMLSGRHSLVTRGMLTALHCTALHCTALHCTALYCTMLTHGGRTTSGGGAVPAGNQVRRNSGRIRGDHGRSGGAASDEALSQSGLRSALDTSRPRGLACAVARCS
eukprot:1239093-Pyramimonas_sp.AAC.4